EAFVNEIEGRVKFVDLESEKAHAFVGSSGAGKTSFSIKFASLLHSKGHKPLLINGDPLKLMSSSFLKSVSKVLKIDCVDLSEFAQTNLDQYSHFIFDCPAGK